MSASGIWAVVPVKAFARAKTRLAGAFPADLRQALVRAMLEDVLAALATVDGLAGRVIATDEPEAHAIAARHGARVLAIADHGLNETLAAAARMLATEGARGMLVLPGDIPAVTAAEIADLLAGHGEGRAISLVAAHDGQGTNALLATPPDAIGFAFGSLSFAAHRAAAERLGIVPRVCSLPGMAVDLDTPANIAPLARRPMGPRTFQLLDSDGLLRPQRSPARRAAVQRG
ncbi:MAG: 2-Phospho-l-lactate Guanylyltransferase,CofC [Xanthobacteraceae bacterium]|jgi:2-phospho-L-lactate guanylyltransferase|nr:2-Phospho-l-lactate Guanylyltransferase,CofC [Xanthobacteraceae bacterium]